MSVFIDDFERTNFNDYHQECEAFVKGLNSAFKTSFPIKKKTCSFKRFQNPWLTDDVMKCIDRKHLMYKQVLKGNCDIVRYRRYRNFCAYIMARAKRTYYLPQ